MDKILSEFQKPSYQDWENQLIKDLRGQDQSLIQRNDEIEEFEFNCYQHADLTVTSPLFSYVDKPTNSWVNLFTILVSSELEANKKALQVLNMGASGLRFICSYAPDLSILTNEIQLEFIQTTFVVSTREVYESVLGQLPNESSQFVSIEFDLIENPHDNTVILDIAKNAIRPTLVADGFSIQQRGATTWQEIAYCVASAHEYLNMLISAGMSCEDAQKCIHFNVGSGGNYFYEIAKIRALRIVWNTILNEYESRLFDVKITGIIGFINKSVKDPHTNLLRQTTEAMSLINSGVDQICILPHDSQSTSGTSSLSERMAINIPLVLQEESYFDKVIDPLAGSYSLELLTKLMVEKSWNLFQEIENDGGISKLEVAKKLKSQIAQKAADRIAKFQSNTTKLIGINIFPNPQVVKNEWKNQSFYFDLPQLIFEQNQAPKQNA